MKDKVYIPQNNKQEVVWNKESMQLLILRA